MRIDRTRPAGEGRAEGETEYENSYLSYADRDRLARDHLDFLFGDRAGYLMAALGPDLARTDAGKYEYGSFRRAFVAWPEEGDQFLTRALDLAASACIFICPMLRRDPVHRSALGGNVFWCDLDKCSELALERVRHLASEFDARVISSGHGLHIYIANETDLTPEHIESTNKGLAHYLGGDHKWHHDAFLRLPGTYNRKSTVDGAAPRPVVPVSMA